MAPTKIVRRTKRAFQRRERLFRRHIIKEVMKTWREGKEKKYPGLQLTRCFVCGRELGEKVIWIYAPKWKDVSVLVLKWQRKCWKCGRLTPVVWAGYMYCDNLGEPKIAYSYHMERKVCRRLEYLYFDFFGKCYSKSLGKEVYGNICIHCGAYQGNGYVSSEFHKLLTHSKKVEERRIYKLHLHASEAVREALACFETKTKKLKTLVLHHISYNPEITIPVCPICHNRIHHTDKYPHLKPLDRRPDSKKKQKGGEVV